MHHRMIKKQIANKMRRSLDFLIKKMRRKQELSNKMRRGPDLLIES